MRRKEFIRKSLMLTAGGLLPAAISLSASGIESEPVTILYSNDTHSRIDPFPDNALRHAGLGGMTRRATLIRKIRRESPQTLLLDAGDLLHGTPWYELYGGRVEFRLMSEMGYDAMCLGEHELSNGPDAFAEVASLADFPILCANYRVRETPLAPYVRQFTVLERGDFRFGIFGLGVRFFELLNRDQYGDLQYGDPVSWAERLVHHLREVRRCDYIICLSHLGYRHADGGIDDYSLASSVEGIDLIIGGHTHTFLDQPVALSSPNGGRTLVAQAGHSGIRLGRIDLVRDRDGAVKEITSGHYTVGE